MEQTDAVYSSSLQKLKEVKNRMGNLEVIEVKGNTIVEAHGELGKMVADQAQRIFRGKLDKYEDYDGFLKDVNYAKEGLLSLEKKAKKEGLNPRIATALKEYRNCLSAWEKGTGLNTIDHPFLSNLKRKGSPDGLLAFMAQHDYEGCLSGMVRADDSSILFWHTEESIEEKPSIRIDKSRIVRFIFPSDGKNRTLSSFIYPDLLPGSGFCFGNNFFQMVDTQHVKPSDKPEILANTAAWITWRLGDDLNPETVLRELSPFTDGYSLNIVAKGNQCPEAKRIDFAHDFIDSYPLDLKKNSTLVVSNIFQQPEGNKKVYEEADEEALMWNNKREAMVQRALHLIPVLTKRELSLPEIARMLAFKTGGIDGEGIAFSNVDVKAWVAGRLSSNQCEVIVDSGPALKATIPAPTILPNLNS